MHGDLLSWRNQQLRIPKVAEGRELAPAVSLSWGCSSVLGLHSSWRSGAWAFLSLTAPSTPSVEESG